MTNLSLQTVWNHFCFFVFGYCLLYRRVTCGGFLQVEKVMVVQTVTACRYSGTILKSFAERCLKAPWLDQCFILTLTTQLGTPAFMWQHWPLVASARNSNRWDLYSPISGRRWNLNLGLTQWNTEERKLTVSLINQCFADFLIAIVWPPLNIGAWGCRFTRRGLLLIKSNNSHLFFCYSVCRLDTYQHFLMPRDSSH